MERTPLLVRRRWPSTLWLLVCSAASALVITIIVAGYLARPVLDAEEAVGGDEERFASYANGSAPLIVDLHGWGGTPTGHRRLSGIDEIAQRHNLHVLWPSGYYRAWNAADGTYPPASTDRLDHVSTLNARIAEISRAHNVSRVILSGFSNGCAMVYRMLVETSGFAAAVCAGHYRPPMPLAAHGTPILLISGYEDPWVATDVQMNETLHAVAAENGCTDDLVVNETQTQTLYAFTNCTHHVVSVRLKGRGHSVYGPHASALQEAFLRPHLA